VSRIPPSTEDVGSDIVLGIHFGHVTFELTDGSMDRLMLSPQAARDLARALRRQAVKAERGSQ
jgi:hypothetical protein